MQVNGPVGQKDEGDRRTDGRKEMDRKLEPRVGARIAQLVVCWAHCPA